MKIEEFLEKVKGCKKSGGSSGSRLRANVNHERTIWNIYRKEEQKICKYCGTDLTKAEKNLLVIEFHCKQKSLSIFQANLLFMVYNLNKVPIDYAKYHECIAGKRFIENIKNITSKD